MHAKFVIHFRASLINSFFFSSNSITKISQSKKAFRKKNTDETKKCSAKFLITATLEIGKSDIREQTVFLLLQYESRSFIELCTINYKKFQETSFKLVLVVLIL